MLQGNCLRGVAGKLFQPIMRFWAKVVTGALAAVARTWQLSCVHFSIGSGKTAAAGLAAGGAAVSVCSFL
jgi:hypothetical protein